MEKQYLFAIILLVILVALVGVSSGKFQEVLIGPFQEGINWGAECQSWAMNSACNLEKVPQKLTAAISKEGHICKELTCGGENVAGCKCGTKDTTNDPLKGKNLYCCASKDGGKVYPDNKIGDCNTDCVGGVTPSSASQAWYKCCQVLPLANLKSACGCGN